MKTIILLLALLLTACKAEIASDEQADAEISKLLGQYREAVFDGKQEKAAELEGEVNELIGQWRDGVSTCSVLAFKRNAQQQLVFLIPFDQLMRRKPELAAEQRQNELSSTYSLLDRSSAAPGALDKEMERCTTMEQQRYTAADVAAIKAAYKPLQEIYSTARTYFPPAMWKVAENTHKGEMEHAYARLQAEQASDREVADCVAAATADPNATAQVTKTEIIAACKTMLR